MTFKRNLSRNTPYSRMCKTVMAVGGEEGEIVPC